VSRGRIVIFAAIAVVGVVALAAAVSSMVRLGRDDGTPVVKVAREDFIRRVYAEGHLKAVDATPVMTPVDVQGPFKIAWLAPDGSRVSEGDVVVRFDPTELEKSLEDGRSDEATAEKRTEKRQIERDSTLSNLSRDADMARLELKYAQEFQSKDPEIFSRAEIIESDIDEDLATHREASASGTRSIQENLAGADLDLLEIEQRKAQLRIQEAEQGLQALEITAPHDGILVYERDWRGETVQVGQSLWNAQPIAEIPNLDAMEAEVYVLEADAGGLAEGGIAELILEARPDEPYQATVKKVDALAKRKIRWVPIQYFGVTLDLERTDPSVMKPGQRVRAILMLDELEDVLVVPRDAVFDDDDRKIVYRRVHWSFEPVEVELGPSALGRVVIESGLEEGDVIALKDPTHQIDEVLEPEETGPSSGGSPTGGLR
jgi:multidrug efflux pump subunit AcrA (membrane-fusion protein)